MAKLLTDNYNLLSKNHLFKVVLVLALLALGACSNHTASDANSAEQSDALTKSDYVVAVEPAYIPFVFNNDQHQTDGFDIDVLNAIAKQQNLTFTYKPYPWKMLFDSLSKGDADIAAAGITITEARKQDMDFSEPYFQSRQMLLLGADATKIESFSQLPSLRLAVKEGTTSDDLVKQLGMTDQTLFLSSNYATVKEVLQGNVDAALGDSGVMLYYHSLYPEKKLTTLADDTETPEEFGFALRKNQQALMDQLNKGLRAIKADGTYERIYQKWFGD